MTTRARRAGVTPIPQSFDSGVEIPGQTSLFEFLVAGEGVDPSVLEAADRATNDEEQNS